MLSGVAILFGLIFGWKGVKSIMIARYLSSMQQPAVTVTTMKVASSVWQPMLKSVGNLRAKVGVNITTELAGMVQTIHFTPGTQVEKGALLVQLNAGTELGQLHALQAQVELAKITYQRDKAQYKAHAVSKQIVDADEWNLKNLQAQLEQQTATTEKKTIRAPFSGYLGINSVSPGQYINVGDTITTLQALDPIYADFYFPQQALAQLKVGQIVTVKSDTFPEDRFKGKITTIQPVVDSSTRNVQVEATIPNPQFKLKPGMFTQIDVEVGVPKSYLTIPQSALSFNPYGDIAFIVKESGKKESKDQAQLVVNQVFVSLGDTRGDQVAVLSGLKAGDVIVTSGQLKLKNESPIVINNKIKPTNEAEPKIAEQ